MDLEEGIFSVIIIKGFIEIFKTIRDVDFDDSTYFMEEGYFWYGEDEVEGLAEEFYKPPLNRWQILDIPNEI